MFKVMRSLPALVILMSLVMTLVPMNFALADDGEISFVAQYRQDVEVVLDNAINVEISTLDPAGATDRYSIDPVENLFLGLTDNDPITGAVVPELATTWEVSEDGLTWTFHLRSDVNWMRYDPASGTAETLRPVVAGDFVYGIKRTCDPRIGSFYGSIAAGVIAGCDVVNQTPAEEVTSDLVFGDTTQISAPDDTTVVIGLQFAAGYFFSMTPMWMLRPVHRETLEEFGDEWTQPGNIATNGPYFIQENTRGVRRIFVRNDALAADLFGGNGNIDRVVTTLIEDGGTAFALYQDNQLDIAGIPAADFQNVLADPDLSQEVIQVYNLAVSYFGYAYDKPPFDNVHARRAFSAVIDREAMIQSVNQGRGVPMIHFTPPGLAHAAPINEIGVGYDPAYAANELEAAGYPGCEGFPNVDLITSTGGGTAFEFWVAAAERDLGCDPNLFNIEQVEFSVLLEAIDPETPTQDRANAWAIAWGPDYLDANNFVHDVLSCDVANNFLRPCTEVDDLMDEAARESDPAVRDELYAEIEEAFFGPEGEYPIAPLRLQALYSVVKPWYTAPFETDGLTGGAHYGSRSIDMAAKLAARGE